MKDSIIRPEPGNGELIFYGTVKDNNAAAVKGAVVIVFACFANGAEKSLSTTITNSQGEYSISIQKPIYYERLLGYKVRAGKADIMAQEVAQEDDGVLTFEVTHESTVSQEEKAVAVALNEVSDEVISGVLVPTVHTNPATDISMDSVVLYGSIEKTNGEYCDQRKFQIRAQGSLNWTDVGSETGSFVPETFSLTFSGLLIPGATYEFKAMAHNSAGWGEGSIISFKSAVSPELSAEVTPTQVSSSPKKQRQVMSPKKNPYDIYRSNYWHNLDSKKHNRSIYNLITKL